MIELSETKDWTRSEELEFKTKWPALHRALVNDPEMRIRYLSRCVRLDDIPAMSDEARRELHEEVLSNQRESVRSDLFGFEREPGEVEKKLKDFSPPSPREMFRKYVQRKEVEE